tara:strand:+ start:2972 stop:3979 length:1008 start_codon:yes stop_codon:yes gene_type:complete
MEHHVYSTIQERTDELSSESESDDNEYTTLYSENIGVFNQKYTNHKVFINNKKTEDYEQFRNKYFTRDIEKKVLLIDTKNLNQEQRNTSSYTIYFENETSPNSLNGFNSLKNVIGFRLIKAMVPNIPYQIHDKNKVIVIEKDGVSDLIIITLDPGAYSATGVAHHLQQKLLDDPNISSASVTFSSTTNKYTTILDSAFRFMYKEAKDKYDSSSWRKLGGTNKNQETKNTTQISENPIDQSHHYIDLVVEEIPYQGCKMNPEGLNIIDRIPLTESSGSLVYYDNPYDPETYFHPIELNKLTIKLYEDTHNTLYQTNNLDNSFEFEVILLKNTRFIE